MLTPLIGVVWNETIVVLTPSIDKLGRTNEADPGPFNTQFAMTACALATTNRGPSPIVFVYARH